MRNMIRWQPVNRPATWNTSIDRLFNEFMGRSLREMDIENASCGNWSPAVNILEREDEIVITADLPGLKAEDVEVTIENSVLTLKGERTFAEATEGETYHRVERGYGGFERSFKVPASVDPKKIEARFVNGEMTVTLPKRDSAQVTIYNSADLTLVREARALTVKEGQNKLQFSWANTLIDPTSLEMLPRANADKIDIADLTYPPRVKNLGLWNVDSGISGKVPVEITYFTSGLSWRNRKVRTKVVI